MMFFFPKKYRQHKLALWLMVAELPFTIVILTLTGIASHNLYRTLLWQDGADNGFNSAPNTELYAIANYEPYTPPMVWSAFITQYNLVLGVLSTFFLITKLPVHSMHLFYPPLAAIIHGSLIVLYIVSACYQAGSDNSDPKRPQPGAPWYITKNCSVAKRPSNIPYCMQAKALFAITVIIIVLYAIEFSVSVHSCFITKEERDEILERREEKRVEKEFEEEILKSPGILSPGTTSPGMIPMTPNTMPRPPPMIPRTPGIPPVVAGGGISPYTPRTLAFNRLGSGSTSSDLPLRDNSNTSNTSNTSTTQSSSQQEIAEVQTATPIYFPPPPKKAAKT